MKFPRYFYSCNVCDSTDHGVPLFDFEIVECPACGTRNMTKWEARENLSREWSYCESFGHEWTPDRRDPLLEHCATCESVRDFKKKVV